MKKRFGLNANIVLLLGLMALSIIVAYLPHHHHEGIVCMEQNDSFDSHSSSDEECHIDNIEIENKVLTKHNHVVYENSALLNTLTFVFTTAPKALNISPACDKVLDTQYYYAFSHKLRGSPFFS